MSQTMFWLEKFAKNIMENSLVSCQVPKWFLWSKILTWVELTESCLSAYYIIYYTAGLLKRQQSEECELSLNNESSKLNEVNWLLRIPLGYAHDKKKIQNPQKFEQGFAVAPHRPTEESWKWLFAFILVRFILIILISWIFKLHRLLNILEHFK